MYSIPQSQYLSPFFYLYFSPMPFVSGFEQRRRLSDLILQKFEEFKPTKGSAQGRRDSFTHTYTRTRTTTHTQTAPLAHQ